MRSPFKSWEVFRSCVVDGVTYVDAGDPRERGAEHPAPDSCGIFALGEDGDISRCVTLWDADFGRILRALNDA